MKDYGLQIEQALDRLIPERSLPYQNLFKAARYALLGGGKRLRPILTLATVDALGGSIEAALQPACTLEMVHAYSLIHDDLPSMDNDDFRRGKPSLHRAFPEGLAILAGDFLLTHAFEVLEQASGLTANQKLSLIKILSRSAGGHGMIGGQVMDIELTGLQTDLKTLQLMHKLKTGAMLVAAMEFGGIIAQAPEAQMASLRQFGEQIGLAFQIVDDILDVTSSTHGKKRASDIANNKNTYVSLLGLARSQELAQELYQNALETLKGLSCEVALLTELAHKIVFRTT